MPEISTTIPRIGTAIPAGRKNGDRLRKAEKENDDDGFDFSKKIRELRLELEIKKREEERIEKDIALILEENTIDGGEQNRSFGLAVTRFNNQMLVVENSAKQLTNSLKNISSLADTISGRVSALDVAKTRVVGCLQLASDMRDLGTSAEGVDDAIRNEDFETAAQHIHRFLTLDQAVFQIREFKQKDATDSIRHSYEVLSSAKERLSKILKTRMDEAVEKSDIAQMQRFVKLFPLLNEPDEGLKRFGEHLNSKIDKQADENITIMQAGGTNDARMNLLFADTLFLFLENVAGIIEANLKVLENAYGVDKLLDFMFILQPRIDEFFRRLLESFDKRRGVSNLIRQVNENLYKTPENGIEVPDPIEIDSIVSEICMMNTSVEMYWRFVGRRVGTSEDSKEPEIVAEDEDLEKLEEEKRARREKKQKKLDLLLNRSLIGTKMQELIGNYILLEHYYMQKSVQKAIKMDAKEDVNDATSSIVDDVVFIIRKCIKRAAGSRNVDSVCATINNATALLDSTIHDHFEAGIKAGYSSTNFAAEAIQNAYAGRSGQDNQKEIFILATNNSAKLAESLKELQKGLVVEWADVKRPTVEKNKLEQSTTEIEEIARRIGSIAKIGVGELFKTMFKQKIRASAESYRDVSHQLTMQDLEHFEAHDPFVEVYLANCDRMLAEYEKLLSTDNYQILLQIYCAEISQQFEKMIMKCQYNRYGTLQLDREYRQISAYLTNIAGWSAREKCAKLGQIVALLNVETVEEAMDVWQNSKGQPVRCLGIAEVRKILMLRLDFPTAAIKALEG